MSDTENLTPRSEQRSLGKSRLDASAQVLEFDAGLYSIEVASAQTTMIRDGFVTPAIRLDPLPPPKGGGKAFVALLSESSLINPGQHRVYLRVEEGKANVLLTIYKVADSQIHPEIRINRIDAISPSGSTKVAALESITLQVIAHLERSGDVSALGGTWIGQPGGGGTIEGFSITPGEEMIMPGLEYQAVLGTDWNTPWVGAGEFCGSRGLALPLLGLRVRLTGEAEKNYDVQYSGYFVGKGQVGPKTAGESCSADGAPLEAFRVTIVPRKNIIDIDNPIGSSARHATPVTDGQNPPPRSGSKPPAIVRSRSSSQTSSASKSKPTTPQVTKRSKSPEVLPTSAGRTTNKHPNRRSPR